ncbi:5-methyltetrahydropteroyltriglutamate--homocysteine methyltransferase [Lactobacillus salsicarnum]|nr:5-methyltetrahydropteroyltriglutamate--homocysteine methyltransferase [Companilactobacillus mishanensis]MQS88242.1 5-methyltetrahydropteroyltriglutamate--homocysteine methyltransferase [Companilactobacillus mishanensis]
MDFKPFSTSLMGSMPRSAELLDAKKSGNKEEFDKILLRDTKDVIKREEDSGIDVIVDGELSRDNYMSFVADKVDGVKLMSLAEVSALTEDEDSFDESVNNMDADETINNPIAVDRIDTNAVLDFEEIKRLKSLTDKPVKATLPSPYLLTRSMWLEEITGKVYEDRHELGADVVKLLSNEIHRLIDIGVDVIQIDDPILSEVVFAKAGSENTFF